MSKRYQHDYRSHWRKKKHFIVVLIGLAVCISVGSFFLYRSFNTNRSQVISGPSKVVGSVLGTSTSQDELINEPYFTMELPTDWHLTSTVNTSTQHSLSWQSGTAGRFLTLYIDKYPANIPINRLLPITTNGQTFSYGILSDNCLNFTPGTAGTSSTQPASAKWQGVSFICDLPDWIDNKVGTGTAGTINSTTISGPSSGSHEYFFLYTDRSAEPNYSILYTALDSFKAK